MDQGLPRLDKNDKIFTFQIRGFSCPDFFDKNKYTFHDQNLNVRIFFSIDGASPHLHGIDYSIKSFQKIIIFFF